VINSKKKRIGNSKTGNVISTSAATSPDR